MVSVILLVYKTDHTIIFQTLISRAIMFSIKKASNLHSLNKMSPFIASFSCWKWSVFQARVKAVLKNSQEILHRHQRDLSLGDPNSMQYSVTLSDSKSHRLSGFLSTYQKDLQLKSRNITNIDCINWQQ